MGKVWNALKQGLSEFFDDDCMSQAAAVAYYTIFSLPPLLMLVFFLVGLAPIPQSTVNRLLRTQLGVPMAAVSPDQSNGDKGLADKGQAGNTQADNGRDGAMLESIAQRTRQNPGVITQLGPVSTILGGCLLIFTATGVFAQLQYALNRVWEVEPDPEQGGVQSFLLNRLLSLGMILVIGFLLLVSLVFTAILEEVLRAIQGETPVHPD